MTLFVDTGGTPPRTLAMGAGEARFLAGLVSYWNVSQAIQGRSVEIRRELQRALEDLGRTTSIASERANPPQPSVEREA